MNASDDKKESKKASVEPEKQNEKKKKWSYMLAVQGETSTDGLS